MSSGDANKIQPDRPTVVNPPSPNQTRIVRATEADLPGISALAGVIWKRHYPGIITPAQIDYMLAKMYSRETMETEVRLAGIVYERLLVDGVFVAFAAYGPAGSPHVFKLHKLYLHPDLHGRGLGSLLLQHCEREVRALGARRLLLTVNKQNVKALAAYERNGFRIVDSVVVDIGGGFVMDDHVLAKELV
jgi:GNAT superfamily N-acetyltransferase